MIQTKIVMTIKDVADYLGIHPMTVYKFAQKGKIPAFKIGSDWRFHRAYIDRWIEQQMRVNGKRIKAK